MRFALKDYAYPLKVLRYHRLMNEAPRWTPEQLDEWVREKRRSIVLHAYRTVPYHRTVLGAHGISADQADRSEAWNRIPLMDKETVREHTGDLISDSVSARSAVWAETSGSTGLKLRILLDRNVNAAAFALFWRAWGSGGYYRPGQRHAVMKGLFHQTGWHYNRRLRALELSSAQVTPEKVRLFRELILRYRPRFLRGYPSAMYLFARLLREQNLSLHIPMVISGSETLYDHQRREIESWFGARLYNHYTHWERAASILECEAGRLHAQQDYGFHEILDDQGRPTAPGTPGIITVTTLHNRAMPLIRYRTGDVAAWSPDPCPCGQAFPVVASIEGRQTDYLRTPSGKLISGTFAVEAFRTLPHLRCAQIVQLEPDSVEARIVRGADFVEDQDSRLILESLTTRLGPELAIRLRFCELDDLDRSPAGKIRQCFNRLPPGAQTEDGTPLSWGANRAEDPSGVSRTSRPA